MHHLQDDARDTITAMKPEVLAQHQGIVAVGGDGLFQEVVVGVMNLRAAGGDAAAAALRTRIGHIPAGSTDAVAYTLHGTRSVQTAALHIAVGDRMALDVMRVDSADGQHRFSVCQVRGAGFG